jgi:flagellar basal body-associated protein FliL
MSSRMSRMKLGMKEIELRDHLILNVEPMIASFPLEDEGKEILRKKLTLEINDFMIAHQIEGEVEDIKLIYILAN